MTDQALVSRSEWLAARKALLAEERTLTRARDALAAKRRALPWVRLDKSYEFQGPNGKVGLADLFDGRSQLAVYHFMLSPEHPHICDGCAFICDHVDAARQHFENADLSFVAVARAELDRIEEARRRMGWTFRWVSSLGSDFNRDFGVHFTDAEVAAGKPLYNYGTTPYLERDLHGISIFARLPDGTVAHTYSTYARGGEILLGAFNWLDFTPKGRNETGIMSWVKLHDEYGSTRSAASCCSDAA